MNVISIKTRIRNQQSIIWDVCPGTTPPDLMIQEDTWDSECSCTEDQDLFQWKDAKISRGKGSWGKIQREPGERSQVSLYEIIQHQLIPQQVWGAAYQGAA